MSNAAALMMAQHHQKHKQVQKYVDAALELAQTLVDPQLLGSALYRRARIRLIQGQLEQAQKDIDQALSLADRARGPLKGSMYLLAAEIYSFSAAREERIKSECRRWQEKAAHLIYKQRVEEDGTFLSLSLYAVHHERAKTLLRFILARASRIFTGFITCYTHLTRVTSLFCVLGPSFPSSPESKGAA